MCLYSRKSVENSWAPHTMSTATLCVLRKECQVNSYYYYFTLLLFFFLKSVRTGKCSENVSESSVRHPHLAFIAGYFYWTSRHRLLLIPVTTFIIMARIISFKCLTAPHTPSLWLLHTTGCGHLNILIIIVYDQCMNIECLNHLLR